MRHFLFLVTAGIVVTVYRSFAFGIYLSVPETNVFQEELSSFLAPQGKQEIPKKEKKQKITKSAYRHQTGFSRQEMATITFNLTHFFSHIPKTGAEYAVQELGRFMAGTIPLPRNKSIFSIRDAQKRYSEKLKKHKDYNRTDPEWEFFDKNSLNHDHANPDSEAYAPPMVCNSGNKPFLYMSPFHFAANNNLKYRCKLIMAELPWTKQVPNVYTIIRDPVSHVVSQYHHCVDSNHHKKSYLMPSFSEWLDEYIQLVDTLPLEKRPPYVERLQMNRKQRSLKKQFNCYDPIDSESIFAKFPVLVKDDLGNPLVLPRDYNYPYPPQKSMPRDEKTRKIDQLLFDDLKDRFRIIGDTSRMIKTICSIFIDMTGGKYIPRPCDCTHWDEASKQAHSSNLTFQVPNLYNRDLNRRRNSHIWIYRPFLTHGYNPKKHAHGVKTRGSEFVEKNLTDYQKIKITHHLRTLDSVLYNISRAVFDEQTIELENRHGIKICDDSFNREGELILEYFGDPTTGLSGNKKLKAILSESKG